MNASKNNSLIKQLQKIAKESRSLRSVVAKEALAFYQENIELFFEDLLNHGCASGMVSSLIYYVDTHKFYDTYYNQIEDLRYDYENSIGEPITIKGDLKNFLAWFAFEETTHQLANELGLEI